MESLLERESLTALVDNARAWLFENVFVLGTLIELGVVLVAAALSWLLARPLRALFERSALRHGRYRPLKAIWTVGATVAMPLVWLLLQWTAIAVAKEFELRHGLLTITASLLTAWVVIRIVSSLVRDAVWSKVIAVTAWSVAALNIVGLLDPTVAALDALGTDFGDTRISALAVIKGVVALGVLLWFAGILSNIFESRIKTAPNLTPSVQVLVSKLFKVTLIALVVVGAISSVGIDITAFAVFGGAIGVGIGFGLQKIVSNLISGLILLLDKSIKPGDVIAVPDYFGRVDSLGARYVSVLTRDGVEHLIPNEELIVNRVENWSHSNNLYRIRLPLGVHYQSDVHKARELCLEAAAETDRVLDEPKTACLLRGFGDSSVDLEIRFWIDDPMNGRANVSSEILTRVWDKFHEHGIEIPYPQRDLHLRTPTVEVLGEMMAAAPTTTSPSQ